MYCKDLAFDLVFFPLETRLSSCSVLGVGIKESRHAAEKGWLLAQTCSNQGNIGFTGNALESHFAED